MMARLLPFPLLSLSIALMWMLLTGFSTGHAVLALLMGLLLPRVMLRLDPPPARIHIGPAIPRLAIVVLVDIFRSNYAVGKIILSRRVRGRSGFLEIPLELENRYGLAVLAIVLTATPGTLWIEHDMTTRKVLLHVLDLVDDQEWIDLIKGRYEPLLMEIFR